MGNPPKDFFTEEMALKYDERNRKLAPISESLHFLIRLVLKDVPAHAHILCVGVGTGAELLSLASAFPEWTFLALDPSASMLDICRKRAEAAGILDRCQFRVGFIQDVSPGENFDVGLSILVAHFVGRKDRLDFYQNISERLKKGGYLINAEISFDLNSPEFSSMLKNWEGVQSLMGGTPESLATLPKQLKEVLTVLSPAETEGLLRGAGIPLPIPFFQAFMIRGWYGVK
jgi:tRNA (cmo5U34)-methyltransferase